MHMCSHIIEELSACWNFKLMKLKFNFNKTFSTLRDLNIDHTNKILHFQKPSICTQSLGTFCFLNFTKLICTSFNLVQIGRCSNWNISIYLLFTPMLIILECCRMERMHDEEIIEISKLLKWIIETLLFNLVKNELKKVF